jgi:diguanylate cyclase (GGDEF)-like protein/PAS domain S-box-containing protein
MTEQRGAAEATEESQAMLKGILEYAPDAVVVVNDKGNIARVNHLAVEMFGYGNEELIGRRVEVLLPHRFRAKHKQLRALYASEPHIRPMGAGLNLYSRRKDGSEFPVDIMLSPIPIGGKRFIIATIRDITERKRIEERLAHEASHDALTGLPNRAWFMELLRVAIARSKRHDNYQFAVLFLDLDNFKVINDSVGHTVADQILTTIARKLQASLRPEDVCARFGGDEFTILLDGIHDIGDATRVARRIQKDLTTHFTLEGNQISTSASIGIALSVHGYDLPEDCLRDADTAMYRAKTQGKACHEVFDRSIRQRSAGFA